MNQLYLIDSADRTTIIRITLGDGGAVFSTEVMARGASPHAANAILWALNAYRDHFLKEPNTKLKWVQGSHREWTWRA